MLHGVEISYFSHNSCENLYFGDEVLIYSNMCVGVCICVNTRVCRELVLNRISPIDLVGAYLVTGLS